MDSTDLAVAQAREAAQRFLWPRKAMAAAITAAVLLCGVVGWLSWRVAQVDAHRRHVEAAQQAEIVAGQRQRVHDICVAFDANNSALRTALHTFATNLGQVLAAEQVQPPVLVVIGQLEATLDRGLPLTTCPPGAGGGE